jgi:hypothetical protein
VATDLSKLVSDVTAAPLGDVIAAVGAGVAAAQAALDAGSLAQTLEIYSESGDAGLAMLREIGYRPVFYTLPETTGEMQVSLRLSGGQAQNGGALPQPTLLPTRLGTALRSRVYATPVDAGFRNQFSFDASVTAKLTFKIVPVPPPLAMEDIRVVPALIGRSVGDARLVLETLGLAARIVDKTGTVVTDVADKTAIAATDPAASAITPAGSTVTITIA